MKAKEEPRGGMTVFVRGRSSKERERRRLQPPVKREMGAAEALAV